MNIINKIVAKIVGSRNDRLINKHQKMVQTILNYETEYQTLSDEQLKQKTAEFKQRLTKDDTLESLLPEAFAVMREVSVRVLGLRHYDVQMIGGIVLNQGNIAEMGTGEGKTLVATLPSYLNALSGKGVHVVTVNDYLANRDGKWVEPAFNFLGLSVGVITTNLAPEARQDIYQRDVVYVTNNELGFDYLRDNMAFATQHKVQQQLNFAIVDEVDSILVDEARTPLIISGPADDYGSVYRHINTFIGQFSEQKETGTGKDVIIEVEGDYIVEEKHKQVLLSERGSALAEDLLKKVGVLDQDASLYDASNILLTQHLNAALRAHICFNKDVDYIVQDDEIVIVDEFTGRTMAGRRWSEGLHQAIEAKENVSIKKENQTLASITFQNYFRLYNKLSGMTGTADTEAAEFQSIYGLEVVVIPPNRPSARNDMSDMVYLTTDEKYSAIVKEIRACLIKKQPVLVGTASIETSELLSDLLTQQDIKHEVLNAKQHEREAQIIANAGRSGSITIATNMAGRGTDIVLGGKLTDSPTPEQKQVWQVDHDRVLGAGGLHILGTERNESRRVDNQLRGRSGRQGDVGSTRFYLSLEDNLMRIFASDRVSGMMNKLGMEQGEAIEHNMVNRAIEGAQRKVEGYNFDSRKQLLEYDNVANDQRKIVYKKRDDLMSADDVVDNLSAMRASIVGDVFAGHINASIPEDVWDVEGLTHSLKSDFSVDVPLARWLEEGMDINELLDNILQTFENNMARKETLVGSEAMRHFEKAVMLQTLDHFWKEHLAAMDYLRQSIGLRGYAQKNPVQEYKKDAFEMFKELLFNINAEIVKILSNVKVDEDSAQQVEQQKRQEREAQTIEYQHAQAQQAQQKIQSQNTQQPAQPFVRKGEKVGRNDPCPCDSGKKYKQCHGKQ